MLSLTESLDMSNISLYSIDPYLIVQLFWLICICVSTEDTLSHGTAHLK